MSVATGALLLAGGALAGSALSGAGGGGLTASVPSPSQTAGSILQAQLTYAPAILGMAQNQDPQYQQLENSLLNQSIFGGNGTSGLLSIYGQEAPQLQAMQTGVNSQQAASNIGLVNQYGSSALQAYQAANPQLQQLQGQITQMGMNQQNPVGQISAGNNQTVNQLNQVAQQQLGLGGSMSQQQASTVSGQIMANYNQQGRANDPTAIAGMATGLDTYSNQLLQQRETNAATAGQLGAQQQLLNLQGGQANQMSQLQNAQYQAQLLTTGANLASSTAVNPYSLVLGQSGALGNAMGTAQAAGNSGSAATSLANQYNPFNTQLMSQLTSSGTSASLANQNVNAGLLNGGLSLLGSGLSGLGGMGSLAAMMG